MADLQSVDATKNARTELEVSEPRRAAGLSRVLKTEVPLIVTLAHKREPAAKVLQYGPGTILEFDQSCDQPLQLSVNNLPIGLGEAVKIGDHFGLRILSILPAENRIKAASGKRTL